MRVCLVTTFYPNSALPQRAVFVRNLAVALQAHATMTIVAPVPFAPPLARVPRWKLLRSIPMRAADGPMPVLHPRFVAVPKLEVLNGLTYCLGVVRVLRALAREPGIDLLHAHCAYPDAVGVALAAAALRLPFVVTAHGSDVNVYADKPALGPQLRWALRRAHAVIAVSEAIRAKLAALAPELAARLVHIPCAAADPRVFAVRDQLEARRRLKLDPGARIVLFAGLLLPIKGLDTLVRAWGLLRQSGRIRACDRLVIAGAGPLLPELQRAAHALSVSELTSFIGEVSQEGLSTWMSAANLFCLPSRNEGTPNVVVESLASGRPVVASAVGGIPDLVHPPVSGALVVPENPAVLADALAAALERRWDAAQIAATMSGYTWDVLAQRNADLWARVLGGTEPQRACL